MHDPLLIAVAVCLTFFVAGVVKGVIGMGLPTVAIGLLTLLMPPAQAAAILIVPSFFTNVWQAGAGTRLGPLLRRLWPLLVGVCVGTWAGIGLLSPEHAARATIGLGATLVIYALIGLSPLHLSVPTRAEPWLAPLVGLATGLISAGTGVFVMPGVPYLHSLGLQRDDLVQALGIFFTVTTTALAINLFVLGAMKSSVAGLSFLALVPAVAGMYLGQIVRTRVSPTVFRYCFFIGMLLLGAHLLIRTLA
jgi:uncharacterized membrane protein YfcA